MTWLRYGRAVQYSGVVDTLVSLVIAGVVARWAIFLALALKDWVEQRRSDIDPADVEPVTALVPAWNEEAVIERTVRSLLASDTALDVIVVDDGSTDRTAEVVRGIAAVEPRVRLLQQPANAGKPAALNAGLEAAQTRLVVTVDADTLVDPACVRWLVATQRRTGADAVCSNVRVGNRNALLTRFQSLEYIAGLNLDRRALAQLRIITTVPGAAALWVREVVLAHGGFSGDTLAEDTDLSITLLRAGRTLVFQDRADAYTEAPTTVSGLFRQRRRWLGGNLRCIAKHGTAPGASARVRWLAMPNLWFAHIGVYLLPLVVSAWVGIGRDGVEIPVLVTLGSVAVALDWVGLLWFYGTDRTDKVDLLFAPLQRTFFPWFVWAVFATVVARPPRSWAKITRRGTAELG
ncbi:MAG: glycosyltransferase family 2 protein [Alphaproteobacteria bacterium]|nr:glycosyltransferase family 2 protein [Alphaproteobacteria bacterium]